MQITLKTIENMARDYEKAEKNWHFHILVPNSTSNQSNEYVLVLENSTDQESFVRYSGVSMTKTAQKLTKLIENSEYAKAAELAMRKVEELNAAGGSWHHTILPPDCIFNQNKPKWVSIFEDLKSKRVIKTTSD